MPTRKLKIVVTRKLPAAVELRMKELFDARLNEDDHPFTQEELAEAMQTADVLVPTVTDHIDGRLLARAGEQLRLIAQFGAGRGPYRRADRHQRGITVSNTPGVLTDDTADMAMALILAVPRRLPEGAQMQDGAAGWLGADLDSWAAASGASGSASSAWAGSVRPWRAARGPSACRSIITTASRSAHADIEEQLEATYWDSLDQMIAGWTCLHQLPAHAGSTFHLMNARRMKLMKPEAVIVNTARGAR
jgi:glyoxylate reductase